jgi:holo-[acyl-carrier protein] synthase
MIAIMKITCGTDIIEIDRIKKAIENLGDTFLKKIFTEKEIEYCESHKAQKYEHYAARFAAKEATFKAISDLVNNIEWNKIEVINLKNGRPKINLLFEINSLESIDISISHCKSYASANVVAVFKD